MRDKVNIRESSAHKNLAGNARRKHQEYVYALNETMKWYKTSSINNDQAKTVTTGAEACSKIAQGLIKELQ